MFVLLYIWFYLVYRDCWWIFGYQFFYVKGAISRRNTSSYGSSFTVSQLYKFALLQLKALQLCSGMMLIHFSPTDLTVQVKLGMNYLHECKPNPIIHCDLKPKCQKYFARFWRAA